MASFPRTITPSQTSRLKTGSVLQSWGDSGIAHKRSIKTAGFQWTETFTNLLRGDPDAEKLLAFIEEHHSRGKSFTIKHQSTPGSGLAPNGTGASGVSVKGGSQEGNSLLTDGWSASTSNVVMRGDVLKVGSQQVIRVRHDTNSDTQGDAAIDFYPALISSPADNTSITTTDVEFDAKIIDVSDVGISTIHYDNKQITIQEVV